ncbi:EndoU domain-containing protein [Candidatus Babeliales bacterium]|nr:EndoU domain-containing protein [Candidatus Babeliales bacterium]
MLISHYSDMNQDDLLEAKFHSYHQKISELHATLSSFSKEDILRKATALGVEAILLHKITGALCNFTKVSSEKLITFIETSQEHSELIYAVEGVPFKISTTATDYLNAMALEGETALPKLRGKTPKPFKGNAKKLIPFKEELSYLKARFDGFKNIMFDFNHMLQGRPLLDSKNRLVGISGWHHDTFENIANNIGHLQGIPLEILSRENGIAGTYKLIFKGYNRNIPKTFFPSTWTRDQVISKIIEAYKYAEKNNIPFKKSKNGNIKIIGVTKDNIKINMVLNQNKMITAYPVVEKI